MSVAPLRPNAGAIAGAIRDAAQSTGTRFDYLLRTATIESDLDPSLKAKTSSATGLFQFIDQTWLATLKEAGGRLGYAEEAAAITRTSTGRYLVIDGALRSRIMGLRKDPIANALMAGAFTQGNAARLRNRLGRDPSEAELYVAHFLGAGGAGRLITTAERTPAASAAALFPAAARANRTIFYDKAGKARSAAAVYDLLVAKYGKTPPGAGPGTAIAASPSPETPAIDRATAPVLASGTPTAVPPIAATTPAWPTPRPELGEVSMFHALFQIDNRGPLSNAVSELWGGRAFAPRSETRTPDAPSVERPDEHS